MPRLLGELLGKLGALRGVPGNCCRDCPCPEEQRSGSLRSSSPGTPPCTPSFPGCFPSSLHSNSGEFGLRGPVDGWANGKQRNQKEPSIILFARSSNMSRVSRTSAGGFFVQSPVEFAVKMLGEFLLTPRRKSYQIIRADYSCVILGVGYGKST